MSHWSPVARASRHGAYARPSAQWMADRDLAGSSASFEHLLENGGASSVVPWYSRAAKMERKRESRIVRSHGVCSREVDRLTNCVDSFGPHQITSLYPEHFESICSNDSTEPFPEPKSAAFVLKQRPVGMKNPSWSDH